MSTETPAEMLSRLRLMAGGDPTWDLSPRDTAAIRWAVEQIVIARHGSSVEGTVTAAESDPDDARDPAPTWTLTVELHDDPNARPFTAGQRVRVTGDAEGSPETCTICGAPLAQVRDGSTCYPGCPPTRCRECKRPLCECEHAPVRGASTRANAGRA